MIATGRQALRASPLTATAQVMTVTMQSALRALQASTMRLRDMTRELELIAVQDAPRNAGLYPFDVVRDAALELASEAEQANAVLRQDDRPAWGAAHRPGPAMVARCQAHVNALGKILVQQLAAPKRLADLTGLRDGGREAGAWAEAIVRCVEACQSVMWTDLQPALLGYWAELSEDLGGGDLGGG